MSSPSVASLPKSSCCTTALWVKSCGCFSAGSSARGVVPSLPDPWWCKGDGGGCHKSAPLELWGPPCCPSLPLLPQLSLWCAGGNLLSHFLLSLFFSQKSPPLRGARTPDKHGAIEGAECSWSSELLRAGVGLPEPKKLEDTGTNQRGSSVFVKKSLSGTEHRLSPEQ